MWVYGLDRVGLGQRQVADVCECDDEPSGSVKCREFLDQLQTSQLLKKDSAPWSELILSSYIPLSLLLIGLFPSKFSAKMLYFAFSSLLDTSPTQIILLHLIILITRELWFRQMFTEASGLLEWYAVQSVPYLSYTADFLEDQKS